MIISLPKNAVLTIPVLSVKRSVIKDCHIEKGLCPAC